MGKIRKEAAGRDLSDMGATSAPGERKTDLESIIAEKSLLQAIVERDAGAQERIMDRAERGQTVRII